MTRLRILYCLIALPVLLCIGTQDVWAQRFAVASFKVLSNDVSAFINPVRDLNDEDCGLIKVIASEDFAFSTPLGIVKREDKVGEIWLYVPRGSKKITIKHAEWGVLRDYVFPSRIDSHITYEIRLDEPVAPVKSLAMAEPVITTVVDTLVLTRVDTLVVQPVKVPVPLAINAIATIGYGGKTSDVSGGIAVMALKRHGGFVHAASDFGRTGSTVGECDRDGVVAGTLPFYTGRTRQKSFMVNAGAAHRLSRRVAIFEGIGYYSRTLAWELAPSEGGGYVKNSYYSTRNVTIEAGVVLTFKRIVVSASTITLKGTEWFGCIGIGITLGKQPR